MNFKYRGSKKDSRIKNTDESSLVEFSIELSNISLTPKDFELTNYLIEKLVSKDC